MSLNAIKHAHWDIVLAVNALRNKIAHNHAEEQRRVSVDRIRQLLLASTKFEETEKDARAADADIIVFACAISDGFLSHIEEDLVSLRGELDVVIAKYHEEKKG